MVVAGQDQHLEEILSLIPLGRGKSSGKGKSNGPEEVKKNIPRRETLPHIPTKTRGREGRETATAHVYREKQFNEENA